MKKKTKSKPKRRKQKNNKPVFRCTQCGKCCRTLVIPITYSDIKRWQSEGRQDILKETVFCRDAPQGDGFYFEHTIVKGPDGEKQPCIFLDENNQCSIHDTKPKACKDAPDVYDETSMFQFICPAWVPECNDPQKVRQMKKEQNEDFRDCVTNFHELLQITFEARGFKVEGVIVEDLPLN